MRKKMMELVWRNFVRQFTRLGLRDKSENVSLSSEREKNFKEVRKMRKKMIGLVRRNFLWELAELSVGIALILVFSQSPVFAGDIENKLSTDNGTTAFEIRDSGDNVVSQIDSLGRVGIGTTNPQGKLHILSSSTEDPYVFVTSHTASGFGIVVSTGGNVGIGTETPSTSLYVSEDGALNNGIRDLLTLEYKTTGTPANGIGAGLVFKVEYLGGTREFASIDTVLTDVSAGSKTANIVFNVRSNETMCEPMRIEPRCVNIGTAYIGTANIGTANIGTNGSLSTYLNDFIIKNVTRDEDIIFQVNDDGTTLSPLTLIGAHTSIQGPGCQAKGDYDVALGINNITTSIGILGGSSFAAGDNNTTDGFSSVALGKDNIAGGLGQTGGYAIGENCQATGVNSVAMGETVIAGTAANTLAFGRDITNNTQNSFMVGFGTATFTVLGSNGNVGIGTTSPDGKLDVQDGGIYVSTITAPAPPNVGKGVIYAKDDKKLYFKNADGTAYDLTQGGGSGQWTDAGTYIYANNYSSMVVTNSGNVGIGTTSPDKRLTIKSSVSGVETIVHIIADDGGEVMQYGKDDNDNFFLAGFDGDGQPDVVLQTSGDSWINAGNFGIGTTSPKKKLHVYGHDGDGYSIEASSGVLLATAGGNVGIGMDAPTTSLHVTKEDATTDGVTDVLSLEHNTTGSPSQGIGVGLVFKVERYAATQEEASIDTVLTGVGADSGDANIVFKVRSGETIDEAMRITPIGLDVNGSITAVLNDIDGINAMYNTGTHEIGYDIAELFETSEPVEPGDVLIIGSQSGKLKKSGSPYEQRIVGVVSGAPAILFEGSQLQMAPDANSLKNPYKPPVAIAGRVPVKVTLENGPIKAGDYLTTSSKAGYAMRATESGLTIGIALESFGFKEGEREGMIRYFINIGERNTGQILAQLKKENTELREKVARLGTEIEKISERLSKR